MRSGRMAAVVAGVAGVALVAGMSAPVMASGSTDVIAPAAVPAAVGTSGGYSGAQVSVVPVTCSGGTDGTYVAIPPGLTAAIDVAAGVWMQPPSWILGKASGIASTSGTSPTSDTCYEIASVTLDGETFGSAPSGSINTSLYPSGNWQVPSGSLPSLGTSGTSSTTTTSTSTSTTSAYNPSDPPPSATVTGSVYVVRSISTLHWKNESASAPTLVPQYESGTTYSNTSRTVSGALQPGSVLTFEHDGAYVTAPAQTCVSPDVLILRPVSEFASAWVCAIPDSAGQSTQRTVQQAEDVAAPGTA